MMDGKRVVSLTVVRSPAIRSGKGEDSGRKEALPVSTIDQDDLPASPEERMEMVWELTLACMAWRGMIEPGLQRSVVHILRPQR